VYFGGLDEPLPDWRSKSSAAENDDTIDPEDERPGQPGQPGVEGMLGFDPSKLGD
jgi:hypothetical protein